MVGGVGRLRACFVVCVWRFGVWMVCEMGWSKLGLESKVVPGGLTLGEIAGVVLSGVMGPGRQDLDSEAGLPTITDSLLLGFGFGWFWKDRLVGVRRRSGVGSGLSLGRHRDFQ